MPQLSQADRARRWRTLPNALSLLRLLLIPPLFAAILLGDPGIALGCFALAVASDLLDGHLARRLGQASSLGGLIDHAVDAGFVSLGLAALAARGVVPALLPPLIAVAFLQYALDSRLLTARGLRGSALGRWNGIAYYALLATPLVRDALGLGWPAAPLVHAIAWALVASTLLSILDRLRLLLRARAALRVGSDARG